MGQSEGERESVCVLFFRSTKISDVDMSYRKTKSSQTKVTALAPICFSFGFVFFSFVFSSVCNRYSPLRLFFYASVNVCAVVFVCHSFAFASIQSMPFIHNGFMQNVMQKRELDCEKRAELNISNNT